MAFPQHTQWMSHWPRDLKGHQKQAKECVEDGAGGIIIFTGWHNDTFRGGFNIPHTAHERKVIFDTYRHAGLLVYAATYLIDLGVGEENATTALLNEYHFDGLIIDVETEWEHLPIPQSVKRARVLEFCKAMAKLTPLIGYAPSWAPDYHHGVEYNAFNEVTDVCMPQIYWEGFHISNTAEGAYLSFRAHWAAGSAGWSHQPALVVPIDDPHYGAQRGHTMAREVQHFKQLVLQEYGHISHWYTPFVPAIRQAIKTNSQPPPVPCPTGYHKDANGNCVPNATPCPAGSHLANGVCVSDTIPCPQGYHLENGACVLDTDPGNPFIDPVTGTLSTGAVAGAGIGAISGVLIGGAVVAAVVVVLVIAMKGAKKGEPVLPHLRRDMEGA